MLTRREIDELFAVMALCPQHTFQVLTKRSTRMREYLSGNPMWCDSTDGHIDDEQCVGRVGKKAAGRLLDGRTHDDFPRAAA